MSQKVNLLSPVGRIVMGSLYDPNTKDADGNPLVVKKGPNLGQPRVNYFFALAIPKNPGETDWRQSPFGQQIYAAGMQVFPQYAQHPTFAWKIEDGDSQVPNKKNRKPCDNEGWRGHWILKFGGGFAPKIYQQQGADCVLVTEKDFVKCGYYAEVAFAVASNESSSQPGIHLNTQMVCFRGYGEEIVFGPDPNSVGFGAAPMPAGASMMPLPSAAPMPIVPAIMGGPQVPQFIPGIPNILPAVIGKQMTAKANGATYESFIAQGWTDEMMITQGFLVSGSVPTATPPAPVVPVIPNLNFVKPKVMLPAANGATYESFIAQGWTDALLVQHGMMAP